MDNVEDAELNIDYEINCDTQAIISVSEFKSKALENSREYDINGSALNVMEHSCEYFGSSYEGRKEGTRKLLGITHKSPIIVEESKKIIFFPTCSPDSDNCVWINLERIEDYKKTESNMSEVIFKDGGKLDLNISYGSLTNQVLRATRLKFVLDERILRKEDNNL